MYVCMIKTGFNWDASKLRILLFFKVQLFDGPRDLKTLFVIALCKA